MIQNQRCDRIGRPSRSWCRVKYGKLTKKARRALRDLRWQIADLKWEEKERQQEKGYWKFNPIDLQRRLTAGDALNVEGWGTRSEIKGHNEMVEETNLAEQVFGEIWRKAGFNLDYIRADQEFYIVVINLGPGARDHAAQIPLRAALNFYSYLLANPRLKETIIGAAVHDRFKSLTDSVTVNDFDWKYWPPNELLLGNASITERK